MFESRHYRRKSPCLLMPSMSSDSGGFGEFGELAVHICFLDVLWLPSASEALGCPL